MNTNIEFQIMEQKYNKRVRCEYTLHEQYVMKLNKQNILNELELLTLPGLGHNAPPPVLIIYENQEIIAYKVVSAFKNRKILNVMVVSKTQSGKTGSMCATIKQYLELFGVFLDSIVGIDLGSSAVKVMELTKKNNRYLLLQEMYVHHHHLHLLD